MSINAGLGMIQPKVVQWVEKFTVIFKNGIFVAGALCILAIDVVTGPIFLGNFNTTHNVLFTAMFWMISMAITAVQMIFWDHALKVGFDRASWRSYAPAIAAGVLMIVDTLLDVGFVTQMLYPETEPAQLIPEKVELIWYMLVLAVGIISLACEPLLMWFFRKLKEESA